MKTRALGATAAAVLLSLLAPAAPAFGSGPVEGTPGTFLTVTPSTNLSASHNVSVSGTGYGNGGTAVILQCQHFCMCYRGVKKAGSWTTTSRLRGIFLNDPAARLELLTLLGLRRGIGAGD